MAEANQMVAGEKAALYRKMQEAVKLIEVDFQGKKPAMDEFLRESQGKNDGILDMLKNRMRQVESEKAEIGKEVQGLKEEVKAAQSEKAEIGKEVQSVKEEVKAVLSEKAELGREVQRVKEEVKAALNEKDEAVKRSNAIIDEKEAAEEKVRNLSDEKAGMEKKVEEIKRNAEAVASETAALKEELDRSITVAEQAAKERDEVQSKLVQLQENWEKYVAD
jgi:chromosome segregation protein